jgi:hypothetical protein
MIELSLLCAALIAFCVWERCHATRRDKAHAVARAALRAEHDSLTASLRAELRVERSGNREATASILAAQDLERKDWAHERSELLTRIQHPGLVVRPVEPTSPDEELMPPEVDESDLVGLVVGSGAEENSNG